MTDVCAAELPESQRRSRIELSYFALYFKVHQPPPFCTYGGLIAAIKCKRKETIETKKERNKKKEDRNTNVKRKR